jgi:hypothetical protein
MFSNYLSNPNSNFIKKYLFEILKDKYAENEKCIDRMCQNLILREDAQDFIKLLSAVFQKGYVIAVDQHKEALSKIGMGVKITSQNGGDLPKIFSQRNQDDLRKE